MVGFPGPDVVATQERENHYSMLLFNECGGGVEGKYSLRPHLKQEKFSCFSRPLLFKYCTLETDPPF